MAQPKKQLQGTLLSPPFPSLQTLPKSVAENEVHPLPRLPSDIDTITPTPAFALCFQRLSRKSQDSGHQTVSLAGEGKCWNSDSVLSFYCLFSHDKSPGIPSPFPTCFILPEPHLESLSPVAPVRKLNPVAEDKELQSLGPCLHFASLSNVLDSTRYSVGLSSAQSANKYLLSTYHRLRTLRVLVSPSALGWVDVNPVFSLPTREEVWMIPHGHLRSEHTSP